MPLIELRDVTKSYGGLRPLRMRSLDVDEGEVVVIAGPDRAAAAVLTDLLTGTTLPDTGRICIGGRATSDIAGQEDWLAFLEQFGIVNDRVVLLDGLSVAANLAVPLTLEIDPMPAAIRERVATLADELGIDRAGLDARLATSTPLVRWFVGLGRAIAHRPRLLLVEHPTATLVDDGDVARAATIVRAVSEAHALASLVVSSDARFSRAAATRRLDWQAASGTLREAASWREWFR